ncbi:hypothetical protein [uncultured Anaerococcus sp.]|uniref:hypothetical protein n=1 Tax=uncultured Anaerococcus sp. TaxID=293428 RepID=UPI00280546E5|nr:hypothetical protein [uncultured Anaerococcus sp.]
MDYTNILNDIVELLTYNRITLIPVIFALVLLILFIISKAFRKSGLFVLALTFAVDYGIRSLPFDLYGTFPILNNVVAGFYLLGAIIFVIKVVKILVKTSSNLVKASDYKPGKNGFFRYTGALAFVIMLLINIIDSNNILPRSLKSLLTSLSFLYMIFRTLLSTYKHLNEKDIRLVKDKMSFDDIDEYLNEKDQAPRGVNSDRRIRKKLDDDVKIFNGLDSDKTKTVKINDPIRVEDLSSDLTRIKDKEREIEKIEKELSNTDIIHLVSREDEKSLNETTIKITNIDSGEVTSYTSRKAKFNIVEEKEYKVDLEFRHNNEYDYGRFIDILIKYAKDKSNYKFELIVSPADIKESKIVLYDPSNIFDLDEEDYQNIGGRIISMNFPKYKINFITGN